MRVYVQVLIRQAFTLKRNRGKDAAFAAAKCDQKAFDAAIGQHRDSDAVRGALGELHVAQQTAMQTIAAAVAELEGGDDEAEGGGEKVESKAGESSSAGAGSSSSSSGGGAGASEGDKKPS